MAVSKGSVNQVSHDREFSISIILVLIIRKREFLFNKDLIQTHNDKVYNIYLFIKNKRCSLKLAVSFSKALGRNELLSFDIFYLLE